MSIDGIETRTDGKRATTRPLPEFRRRLATPARILASALEVFGRSGYASARLEDIGRGIGVTKTAIYLHFSSKQEVFDAVLETFCLPDRRDSPANPGQALAEDLREGDAATLLQLVLREWHAQPGLAERYIGMLGKRMTTRFPALDPVEADRIIREAVSDRSFGLIFTAGR